ncbi:hypothetical protein DFH29DRAFT_878231 [Suillus ampliporus]|nr:hypothetical protein DFH29DRAFT_878231 [Suillus ampliporus]
MAYLQVDSKLLSQWYPTSLFLTYFFLYIATTLFPTPIFLIHFSPMGQISKVKWLAYLQSAWEREEHLRAARQAEKQLFPATPSPCRRYKHQALVTGPGVYLGMHLYASAIALLYATPKYLWAGHEFLIASINEVYEIHNLTASFHMTFEVTKASIIKLLSLDTPPYTSPMVDHMSFLVSAN